MWMLQSIANNNERSFCLLSGNEYQIGRKDCAIMLQDDTSISRKHSVIKLEESAGSLYDFSKYGTYVNDTKVGKESKLKRNDVIQFGQSQHKFRLVKKHLVITTSCINNRDTKGLLKDVVEKLGGSMTNEWNKECTHLVMENLTFTIKAVCALASISPIVTPKFLDDLLKACKDPAKPVPNPTMYIPKISETSLKGLDNLFAPNDERKSLFLGRRFMFLSSKQFKRLSPAITMAGGSAELQEHANESFKRECCSENSLVVAPESKDEEVATTAQKDMIHASMNYLRSSGLRPIKESEIGLAILHRSVENYCNPNKMSDDSIAGTTSSQIIHDTVADFTSQWQIASKPKMKPKPSELKKPQDVFVDDSQMTNDRKRKRSSETSMYITDSVAVDTTSPFQVPKRPNRVNSGDMESSHNEVKARQGGETVGYCDRVKNNEETGREGIKSTKTDEIIQKEEDSEPVDIDELANSILEDDESFEEDLFALDTEVQRNRRSRMEEICANDRISHDKSRVIETQLTFVDDDRKTEVKKEITNSYFGDKTILPESNENALVSTNRTAVRCSDEKNFKPERCDRSRASDSQPLDENFYEQRGDLGRVDDKTESSGRLGKANADPDANFCAQDRNEMMAPLGFKNSKLDRRAADIKPDLDPDEPIASTVIGFSDLIVRKENNTKHPVIHYSNVKNFKKFRKTHFPGKDRGIPRIIGGRDLTPYENVNEEKERMFADFNAINEERQRERMKVDAMFKMDIDGRHRKRRK